MDDLPPSRRAGWLRGHLADLAVLLAVLLVLGGVALAYAWLSVDPGAACTLPHQVLGHC